MMLNLNDSVDNIMHIIHTGELTKITQSIQILLSRPKINQEKKKEVAILLADSLHKLSYVFQSYEATDEEHKRNVEELTKLLLTLPEGYENLKKFELPLQP